VAVDLGCAQPSYVLARAEKPIFYVRYCLRIGERPSSRPDGETASELAAQDEMFSYVKILDLLLARGLVGNIASTLSALHFGRTQLIWINFLR